MAKFKPDIADIFGNVIDWFRRADPVVVIRLKMIVAVVAGLGFIRFVVGVAPQFFYARWELIVMLALLIGIVTLALLAARHRPSPPTR